MEKFSYSLVIVKKSKNSMMEFCENKEIQVNKFQCK